MKMKIWKTIIALAAACFCGGEMETTGQETLTVQYTKEDGSSHTRLVEDDIEVMFFTGLKSITLPEGFTNLRVLSVYNGSLTNISLSEGLTNLADLTLSKNQLTSLSLPKGLVNLRSLNISTNPLTSLKLPEDLAKNADEEFPLDTDNSWFDETFFRGDFDCLDLLILSVCLCITR